MTVVSITLTDPVSGISVPIMPADGVSAQILDVAGTARAVLEDTVNAHGTFDTTRYLTAAAVSLTMLLFPGVTQTPELFLDALGQLLNPAMRPYLIVNNDQWPGPRQLTVRYDSISKPLSDPTNWPVQVSWQAPSAVWEDASLTTSIINAFIASSTGLTVNAVNTGFSYTATSATPAVFTATGSAFSNGTIVTLSGGTPPGGTLTTGGPTFASGHPYYVVGASGASFSLDTSPTGTGLASTSTGSGTVTAAAGLPVPVGGLVVPATSAPAPSQVVSPGNAASQWQALLYGPCTGPKLASDTTGLALEFTDGLVLGGGQFVLLDSATRSAYLNNDPTQPVTSDLNFTTSDWWLIQAGTNILRYYPTSAGAGAVAQINYRSAWQA